MRLKFPRVYYGWWVVAACFLIAFYTGGAVFFGFTAIFEPIAKEFGWSYAQVALAASIRGMEIGLMAPLVGMLIDRIGPRKLMSVGMVIAAIGLLMLSQTRSLAMFYGSYILVAIGISAGTTTVTMTIVAKWFRKKVGLATGLMICGYGASGVVIPIMSRLIDVIGWRETVIALAAGMVVFGIPLSMVVRHRPEQYGLLPDGETASPLVTLGNTRPEPGEVSITVKQAIRTRTFWQMTLGFMAHMAAVHTVLTHVMPYLSSIGMARTSSSLIAMAIPLISTVGRFGFGCLADRVDKRLIMIVTFSLLTAGLVAFEFVDNAGPWLMVLFLVLFSIGYGGNVTMTAVLPRVYFGRGSFGAIIGIMNGVMILGSIIGPPLAGLVFDAQGSYQWVWLGFSVLAIIGLFVITTVPPVKTKADAVPSPR